MHPTLEILGLVITVAVVAGASRRFGWPTPLLLVVAGVVASYLPGIERVNVDPDVILVGLLPPLLYAAAIRTSLVDFRTNRQAIVLLSVGLVGFTTVAVGLVTWWVVPTVSIAAAFALGAVVAPPTPWRHQRSPAGSACPGASCRCSRARASSTTPLPWSP